MDIVCVDGGGFKMGSKEAHQLFFLLLLIIIIIITSSVIHPTLRKKTDILLTSFSNPMV
jgi:hypothetical protein